MPQLKQYFPALCPVCSCEGERPVPVTVSQEDEWLCVQCGCWALKMLGTLTPKEDLC